MPDSDTYTHDYLTVRELAEILRVKERKVYYLASSGQVPCTRATGKLLFPRDDIQAWIAGRSDGTEPAASRPGVFLGSHDPLLSWALGQSQCGLATLFDGSLDGLSRFRGGEGIATGLHLYEPETGGWNTGVVQRRLQAADAVLIGWAKRSRGLVFRPEDGRAIRALTDLRGRRLAGRQPESGADVLLGQVLSQAGVGREEIEVALTSRNEADAVLAVAQGAADAAFGLEAVARQFGLGFSPVISEAFDILIDRRAYFEPPFQRLLSFSRTREFETFATSLGGYDLSPLGTVRWNA